MLRRRSTADGTELGAALPRRFAASTGAVTTWCQPDAAPAPPLRTFFRPRWIALHLVTLLLITALALLGRWQLDVSNSRHFDLQNFSYTLQYWAFAAFAAFFWLRIVRDTRRPPTPSAHTTGQPLGRQDPLEAEQTGGYSGPADLVATSSSGDPVVYRGYVVPDSAGTLVRSHGDRYHDAYNDHLWQLAMADRRRAAMSRRRDGTLEPAAGDEPVVDGAPFEQQLAAERSTDARRQRPLGT